LFQKCHSISRNASGISRNRHLIVK
jgi:hypothetical protein